MMWFACIPASALRYFTVNAAKPPSAMAMVPSVHSSFRNGLAENLRPRSLLFAGLLLGGATSGTRRMNAMPTAPITKLNANSTVNCLPSAICPGKLPPAKTPQDSRRWRTRSRVSGIVHESSPGSVPRSTETGRNWRSRIMLNANSRTITSASWLCNSGRRPSSARTPTPTRTAIEPSSRSR